MSVPSLKTITGTFTGPDGNGIACQVKAVLSQACTVPGTQEVIQNAARVFSNPSGAFTLSLYANNDLTPTSTFYTVTAVGTVDGASVVGTWTIVVPQTAGPFEISNLLAVPPPVPSPPGALDAQVVHLANAETITGVKNFAAGLIASADSPFAGPDPFVDVQHPNYGAKGDLRTVTDGVVSAGSAVLASASAAFAQADVGKYVGVTGAGAAIAAPTGLALTRIDVGGTLAAATYAYRVSALTDSGETVPCTEVTIVVSSGTTNRIQLTWTEVNNAKQYKVYGRTTGAELLIATVNACSYFDTGAVTPSGAMPGVNTAFKPLGTTILSVQSATSATMAANATTAQAAATVEIATNDAPAINLSLASKRRVKLTGGKTYLITAPLLITGLTDLILEGDGSATLKIGAGVNDNLITISGSSRVDIRDLRFDGNRWNINNPGIGAQYVKLAGVFITGGSSQVWVRDCKFTSCYAGGVLADNSSDIYVLNNRFQLGGDNQVFLRCTSGGAAVNRSVVANNIASDGMYSGIQCVRGTQIVFANNIVYNQGITAAQGDGLGFEGVIGGLMVGNLAHDCIAGLNVRHTTEGGSTLHSSQCIVTGNTTYAALSSNGDTAGISVTDSDHIVVSGNSCYGNYAGMHIGGLETGCSYVAVLSNEISGNLHIGIDAPAPGGGPLLVQGNTITGNTGSTGIWTKFPNTSIIGNLIRSNTGDGIQFDSGSNGWVTGNHFYDNTNNAVELLGTAGAVEIRSNVFWKTGGGTQQRALFEGGSAGPTRLVGNRISAQGTEPFHLANASSVARDNDVGGTSGYNDQNSGSGQVVGAGTSVTVNHGLWKAPTRVEVTPTTDSGIAFRYWVDTYTSTQFTIHTSPAVTNATSFDWRAWAWDN